MKTVHIFGGGTVSPVRPHLAISAPAYGGTAKRIKKIIKDNFPEVAVKMHLTKMAGGRSLETNQDIEKALKKIINNPEPCIVVMSSALADFSGQVMHDSGSGKDRLDSSQAYILNLSPAEKLIQTIRKERKDIFLVGFKAVTSNGLDSDKEIEDLMFNKAIALVKRASCNLVLVNDLTTGKSAIVTPEESMYGQGLSRDYVLLTLVSMIEWRSGCTFKRTQIVEVPESRKLHWNHKSIPDNFRKVIDHCIAQGAYKPINGKTVGHYAYKLGPSSFASSIRKQDFNKAHELGFAHVVDDGAGIMSDVLPSAGGQTQRMIFNLFPETDCIVHFHCPKREYSIVPEVSQWQNECGSVECATDTAGGMSKFGNVYAVYNIKHGPNIAFNSKTDPQEVIDFIDANFDLGAKTR